MLIFLNPRQSLLQVQLLDPDGVYRKKKAYDELEEAIAAQLLKARQTDLSIPKEVDADKLADILRSKLQANPKAGEVTGKERTKRIRVLLLLLAMDD